MKLIRTRIYCHLRPTFQFNFDTTTISSSDQLSPLPLALHRVWNKDGGPAPPQIRNEFSLSSRGQVYKGLLTLHKKSLATLSPPWRTSPLSQEGTQHRPRTPGVWAAALFQTFQDELTDWGTVFYNRAIALMNANSWTAKNSAINVRDTTFYTINICAITFPHSKHVQ